MPRGWQPGIDNPASSKIQKEVTSLSSPVSFCWPLSHCPAFRVSTRWTKCWFYLDSVVMVLLTPRTRPHGFAVVTILTTNISVYTRLTLMYRVARILRNRERGGGIRHLNPFKKFWMPWISAWCGRNALNKDSFSEERILQKSNAFGVSGLLRKNWTKMSGRPPSHAHREREREQFLRTLGGGGENTGRLNFLVGMRLLEWGTDCRRRGEDFADGLQCRWF